jgi:hypothetical protein
MNLCVCLGAMALIVSGCMSEEQRAALLRGPYPLQVDHSRSVQDLLGAGKYDHVSYQVTAANFPDDETGLEKISVVLVPFSPQASLDYVLHRLAPVGMHPATAKELLAFGEAYPEVQRKLPIMALGSFADLLETVYHYESRPDRVIPMLTTVERKIERVYPFLGDGLFGRSVNVEWLEDPDAYNMYYACFVQQQEEPHGGQPGGSQAGK